ncbi:Bifunctional inhibitor/lipid-transfer protein/seed storage 2S albumin superfamily protein, partial [Prunus dulcis]
SGIQCAEYVRKLGPEVDPSPACCAVVKKANVKCVCKLVAKEIEDLIDMEVGFVARSCGKKVSPGTKCGSKLYRSQSMKTGEPMHERGMLLRIPEMGFRHSHLILQYN